MRKLAIASVSFSAAVFAANYVLSVDMLPYISLLLILIGIGLIFLKRRWLLMFELMFIFAGIGLGVFFFNASIKASPAAALDGQTIDIECRILDYPKVYDDYARLDVRLIGEDFPKLKAILYDNSLEMTELKPGCVIKLQAKLKSADTRYGKDYDYYNSRDIFLIASSKSSPEMLYEGFHLSALPALMRKMLGDSIDYIFPVDTSGFMRSLLLGDKSKLYEDVALYTDLSRAGFMHVAAVSGMHIAFLVGMLQMFLGCSAGSSVFCIALVWCFTFLTGAAPAAVRAAFMQSVLLMAPVVHRENDPFTSLSTVLALVLAVNPYAATSVGLQLSFGAMAGILCFNEPISELLNGLIPSEHTRKIFHYPIGVLSVSLSVMPATLLLTALHFGEVAILSPLSNMIALWAVSACFIGGAICCILSFIFMPAADVVALIVSLFARYIFVVADIISSIPFAVVYIGSTIITVWLVLTYVVYAIIGAGKNRPLVKLIFPLVLSVAMLIAAQGSIRLSYRLGEGCITVVDVGQGQSIAAISGDNCVVVDCGGGSKLNNAGETVGAYLLSRGITEIDTLMLTHLHSDHANGVLYLLELVDVANIILPADPKDEEGVLNEIFHSAARHGCKINYVENDTVIEFGDIVLEMFAPNDSVDANEECLTCRLYVNDFDILITADGSTAAENELVKKYDFNGVDVLMVGHHGSRYSCGTKLLDAVQAKNAVISVGYNNYGHPTYETLERLDAYGYNIYRTDLNGTVEFHVGKSDGKKDG